MALLTNDILEVVNPPALADVVFRRFRGDADYAGMAAVLMASSAADGVERVTDAAQVAHYYAHLSNCDPYQDMIMAEVEGELVGYGCAIWWQEPNGPQIYFHFGYLKPSWRRKGIGAAMLGWLQARLRQIAATHPPHTERMLQTFALNQQLGAETMLQRAGYTAARYEYSMVRPTLDKLPSAPLPAGLEVRPVQPEHYRLIWDAANEAFQDHWGYSPPTEQDYQGWLGDQVIFMPQLWRIAWDIETNQVAGQVRSFINHAENAEFKRKRGYTEFISVRRPWRKRGLARALIVQSFEALKAEGMTEAALGVDAENTSGALRVYQGVGFEVTQKSTAFRKALD